MLSSRPIFLTALVGLLAASCSSSVVTTPYGAAIAPPRIRESVAPAPAPASDAAPPPVPAQPDMQAYDVAPRRIGTEAERPDMQAYDVAPRRIGTEAERPDMQAYDVAPRRIAEAENPDVQAYDVAPRRIELVASAGEASPLAASKVMLGPLPFISQTVNNCGPASVAEVLAFWGINRGQGDVQSVLRGDGNPYGMTPAGVPSYVASLGLDVVLGTGGTPDLVKELLRAGFPIIVNQTVSDTDLELHYRPIQGFDDGRGVFIASDPLIGPEYTISYTEFDHVWTYTGQRFMVIYPPNKVDALNAALAAGKWDPAYAEGGGQAQAWAVPSSGPPPITIALAGGKQVAGEWYTGPVKLSFRATDQIGFGVANTSYSVDKQPVQLYRGELSIKDPGRHVVTFRSVNYSGSREPDKTVEVGIDPDPPSTAATVEGARDANGAYRAPARLTLAATDEISGLGTMSYSLDGGPAQPYSGPVSLPAGAHTILYSSVDQAGNQEAQKVLNVAVHAAPVASAASAPAAPAGPAPASAASLAPPAGGYSICPQFDPNKAAKVGQPIALKVQLCDAAGKNLSHPSIALAVQGILGPPTGFKPVLPGAFRFDAGFNGYQADEPAGNGQGTYIVYFTAAGDPAVHSVQFRIG